MYKLDRNAFSMYAHEAKEPALAYWGAKSKVERLKAASYLNSVAYNFSLSNPPKMDRNFFSMRGHKKQ